MIETMAKIRESDHQRLDHLLIADMVEPGSKVLDVGCNDGTLLEMLSTQRQVKGRGIELSQKKVNICVARGLSVIQGDADRDLVDYPADAYDYVILSQTIQATHNPRTVLREMLRVGRHAVVSFPNFGHWRVRGSLFFNGRMPVNESLPYTWYDTPNIHFCTIRDFVDLCDEMKVSVERALAMKNNGEPIKMSHKRLANLLGEQAVFLLKR
ncbi:MAG: methionine biosynthesis protein MetW [Hyphomicrobiales bacterium]|nr:MAG: methionine biosynthesis protein MetW [Hyphomicrobiales bacterium]